MKQEICESAKEETLRKVELEKQGMEVMFKDTNVRIVLIGSQ
jgi:hypothetical protein